MIKDRDLECVKEVTVSNISGNGTKIRKTDMVLPISKMERMFELLKENFN